MTDQKHDSNSSQPTVIKGKSPFFAAAAGLLSTPHDESLAALDATGLAPSCPAPFSTLASDVKPISMEEVAPGRLIDDFEIIGLLGRGAFGAVYLARQLSLERQVALKITAWQGGEGRKMARLEHENIVQVFSETAFDKHTRLLCMQYVSGPTLQAVLNELAEFLPAERSGQKLLEAVDRLVTRPAEFDPAAMRNRELLAELDWAEAVCWLGSRLAEALDYAHSHGVIHRDIKPGNIMLNQYGRPLLVDFNLAFQPLDAAAGSDQVGGTLAYMAPEHLDAFAPDAETPAETVAQAADIYSLGVVLYQTASGALPFTTTPNGNTKSEVLRAMAALRRELPPPLPAELPRALDQAIARCLHADPSKRFGSGRELSSALEGCRHFQAAEKAMPNFGRMRAMVTKRPAVSLFILAMSPHLVASLINIAYNYISIIKHLSDAQRQVFWSTVLCYDIVGYVVGGALALRILLPVIRAWPLVGSRLPSERQTIDAARRTAASWPPWAIVIACICWMPGGIIFPLILSGSGPMAVGAWVHLLVSFWLSGLIAATYSTYLVEWETLCVTYPTLWCDRQAFRATAAAELRSVPAYLRSLQFMAGSIPLICAFLILFEGQQDDPSFRFLVGGLIILGGVGFSLSMFITGKLHQAWAALTGANEGSSRRKR